MKLRTRETTLAGVTVAVLAGSLAGAVPANLLANGSFEDAGDSADVAAHWSRWGPWLNRETGWSPTHGGTCEIGYHHWQVESADDSGLWQDVPARAGQAYTFGVWAQHDRPAGTDAESVEVRLEAVDAAGHTTPIRSAVTQVSALPADGTWAHLTVTGTATGGSIRALIRVTPAKAGPRSGAVKLDDATLTAAGA